MSWYILSSTDRSNTIYYIYPDTLTIEMYSKALTIEASRSNVRDGHYSLYKKQKLSEKKFMEFLQYAIDNNWVNRPLDNPWNKHKNKPKTTSVAKKTNGFSKWVRNKRLDCWEREKNPSNLNVPW